MDASTSLQAASPMVADPSSATSWVLPFDRIRARDLPLVGGKGANLGELAGAGFPVPPGFCLTTAVYTRFLEAGGDLGWLWEALEGLDPQDVARVQVVGADVRARLLEVPIPAVLEAAILRAWEEAGVDQAYAVRSSATAEDLPGASFAGQQDTYLNVRGREALLSAVRACWVSLFTDRAILYRIQNGFPHRSVQLSVVVQRMILPDISGIMFTADPVSGHRHRVVIEASFGIGEALVSGLVTPDRYQVDKRDPVRIDAIVADKQCAIRPLPEGGTRQEALDDAHRTARVLTDPRVRELAGIGAQIERHYGAPQDIEWCLEGDQFYIVQSRPITTLYPIPRPATDDRWLHAFLCFSHLQVMTDAMPPMAHSVWRHLLPFGKPDGPHGANPYMREAGGRLYVDITPALLHPVLGKVLPRLLSVGDTLASRTLMDLVTWPRFQAAAKDPAMPARSSAILSWIVPIFRRLMSWVWLRDPASGLSTMEAYIDRVTREMAGRMAAVPAGPVRLKFAFEVVLGETLPDLFRNLVPMIGSGILTSRGLLPRVVGKGAARADLQARERGLSGNVTTEMDHATADLADVARRYPALIDPLHAVADGAPLESLRSVEGGPQFLEALERFLERYGMRGPGEIDISRKRYRDDPSPILRALVGNLSAQGEIGAHRLRHERLAAEGVAAADRLVEAARRAPLGFIRGRIAKRLVRLARHMLAIREHPKFMMINIFDLIRGELLAEAAGLVRAGRLDRVDDVFMLDHLELIAALKDPGIDLRAAVAKARADMARYARQYPPKVMTSEGECLVATHDASMLPPGAIAGTAASSGVVVGRARVMTDLSQEMLRRGEILVTPFTDPGWTPLFINAAGLVMEVGGMMTHGSVVAREYGIPAVVGIPGVTTRIRTGQRIRVDGEQGFVQILDEEADGSTEEGQTATLAPSGALEHSAVSSARDKALVNDADEAAAGGSIAGAGPAGTESGTGGEGGLL